MKKGEGIIKFGGGFYCGKVDDIYVINGHSDHGWPGFPPRASIRVGGGELL